MQGGNHSPRKLSDLTFIVDYWNCVFFHCGAPWERFYLLPSEFLAKERISQ